MVEVRDSVLKANIEGSDAGSYSVMERMLLKHRYVYPGDQKRGEVHGIWRMEGGQMMSGALIMAQTVDYFGMTIDDLCNESRKKTFVHVRHVAY